MSVKKAVHTDSAVPSPAGVSSQTEIVREKSEVGRLSLGQLMFRRFMRNRMAVMSTIVLILMYLMVIFADFLAPYQYNQRSELDILKAPQIPYFFDEAGNFSLRPFVYATKPVLDMNTFSYVHEVDTSQRYNVNFFVRGYSYKLFGFIPTDIHLFGVDEPAKIFLFGTDSNGRDLFSRILAGGRISMTMGLVGVVVTILLGSSLGTISGYYGGIIDTLMQRGIELLMSFPTVPLWAALAALFPQDWSPIQRYFAISLILSLVGWTGLARQVRAKVLSYREMDFASSAKAIGAKDSRIIFYHMLPNAFSHIIIVATLSIPGMILTETALSFLGLGILPPATSWGALLREAQDVSVLLNSTWLLIPTIFVIAAVLAFNFVGDGLRDAADPFAI